MLNIKLLKELLAKEEPWTLPEAEFVRASLVQLLRATEDSERCDLNCDHCVDMPCSPEDPYHPYN